MPRKVRIGVPHLFNRVLDSLLLLTGAERVGKRHPAGGALKGKKSKKSSSVPVPLQSSKYCSESPKRKTGR